MKQEINNYIEKRYIHWLEFSKYHCSLAGMQGEEIDVLNEVMDNLLRKSEAKLKCLVEAKVIQKDKEYTELDFYVLRSLRSNIYSDTAPYRAKFKPIPHEENIDIRRLNIEDISEADEDIPARVLEQFGQVREAFESLSLSPKARRIFEFKFFQDRPFCEWEGPETKKQLYEIYSKVVKLIRAKIFKKTLL